MWGNEKFNQKALFSDESGNYRKPAEPDRGERVEIKFRTARNDVDLVYLICGNQKTAMEKTYSKDMFDYYVCALGPLEGPVHYFFEIIAGNQRCFYNKLGVTEDLQEELRVCAETIAFTDNKMMEIRDQIEVLKQQEEAR